MDSVQIEDEKQPPNTRLIPSKPRFIGGHSRSVARLKQLGYDPIGVLVEQHERLTRELAYQEGLRSGAIVELNAAGKPRSFRAETLMEIHSKLIEIADKLLRYNYGRVPEVNVVEQRASMPLVVNLSKKGDVYVVNDKEEFDPLEASDVD